MAERKDKPFLIWIIIASQFTPPFMFSGVAVALPAMGADLHAGALSLGLVETLFLASQLAFLLPLGRLADASDKRTLYKLGLLGFGLTSALIGLSPSIALILFLRFLQGMASAVLAATGLAILADMVPREKRGKIFGIAIGTSYVGLMLGPICAGFLTDHWNWRAVFFAGAAVLGFGYLLVHFLMPSAWKRPATQSVHLPSAVLIVLAVLALVAGSSLIREGLTGYGLLAASFALTLMFIRLQARLKKPLLDISALVRNHPLSGALLVQMLLYVNAFSSIFMLSIYMQVSLGYSAATAGKTLAIGTLLMTVVSPVAGHLADRYRPQFIASLGVASVMAATLIGASLSQQSGLGTIALMLLFQGLGFALFSSPNTAIIMGSVPHHSMSMASALGAKARSLGMMFGMIITTLLISHAFGNDPLSRHPADFVTVTGRFFSILAVFTAAALVICIATKNRFRRE